MLNGNKLLDSNFAIKTYCDFMKHCQRKGNGVLQALTALSDNANPENDTDNINYSSVDNILSEYGLEDDSIIAVGNGFIRVRDLINQYKTQYQNYYNGTIDCLESAEFSLTDSNDQDVSHVELIDIIDSIKNNLISSMMEVSCLESAKFSGISDRITSYVTKAQSLIDLEDSSALQIFNYYKDKLLGEESDIDLLTQFFAANGSQELNSESGDYVLDDFDISSYTGANPLGTLAFGTVKEAAQTVGKVVGAAAVGIFNAVKTGVSWLWNKAKKYTVEVFDDPYDVTDNGNNKAAYCFDNFQYQDEYTSLTTNSHFRDIPEGYDWDHYGEQTVAEKMIDHWFIIKTVAGELAIKPTDIAIPAEPGFHDRLHSYFYWKGQMVFKPYSVNPDIDKGTSADQFIENFNSCTNGSYLDVKAPELDLYNSFAYGTALTCNIIRNIIDEYSDIGTPYWDVSYTKRVNPVTNLDWLKMATGYHLVGQGTKKFNAFPQGVPMLDYGDYPFDCTLGWIATEFACLIAWIIMRQIANGNNIYDYVPYCKDTEKMSVGRFGIKTDAENQDVATAFTTIIVAIVIVAIVVMTGAIIVRKLTRKAFWKRTEWVGKWDNRMWQGGTLTLAEKRKYIRYSRKLNACQILSKGISAAQTVGEKISSIPAQIQEAINTNLKGVGLGTNSKATIKEIRSLITGD